MAKCKTIYDFLKTGDYLGLDFIVYIDGEEDPIWTGRSLDIPYWVAELKLEYEGSDPTEPPISFRTSLGEEYHNNSGFVIACKE
mgnify:CR=1 FL=1